MNLSQKGMDLIKNGLQPHIFIFHPHVNLRSALVTWAIVSMQVVTLFEDKFSIAYEVAARENPKLFVLYAPTSRCIAVIPSPNEGVYHIQFPRSCSHGLVFSDTAISGTCQKCATKASCFYYGNAMMRTSFSPYFIVKSRNV